MRCLPVRDPAAPSKHLWGFPGMRIPPFQIARHSRGEQRQPGCPGPALTPPNVRYHRCPALGWPPGHRLSWVFSAAKRSGLAGSSPDAFSHRMCCETHNTEEIVVPWENGHGDLKGIQIALCGKKRPLRSPPLVLPQKHGITMRHDSWQFPGSFSLCLF